MLRTVALMVLVFLLFLAALTALGEQMGSPELLIWAVLLVGAEVLVFRSHGRNRQARA